MRYQCVNVLNFVTAYLPVPRVALDCKMVASKADWMAARSVCYLATGCMRIDD